MKKVLKKRTGFTLVELLIVIIIIGILAGAMLLVAGSGTDKAEATKIVSDMRSIKAASLLYYADKAGAGTVPVPNMASGDLDKYMDRKMDTSVYDVTAGTADATRWYVERSGLTANSGVNSKLGDSATASGLFGAADGTDTAAETPFAPTTATSVFMRAR